MNDFPKTRLNIYMPMDDSLLRQFAKYYEPFFKIISQGELTFKFQTQYPSDFKHAAI